MKKVLVSGYIGFNNFGDEAIFSVLSTHLKDLNCKVSVLCNNKKQTKEKYQVETYANKNIFEIIKAILNCDILISGGGSLLQNKTSNLSLFYYLFIILLAKLCFKKTIVFSQGFEPIKGNFQNLITHYILSLVDVITVRDDLSRHNIEIKRTPALVTSDPVYYLVQDNKIEQNKDGLIIQLRNFKGMNEAFLDDLANAIAKNYEGKISVFSFQDEIDKDICLKFIEKLQNLNKDATFIENQSIEKTINIINSAKYIISTRLHGIIISQALKTKTLALIYDDKIKTISNELNIENIDILNTTKESVEKTVNTFFNKERGFSEYRRFSFDILDKAIQTKFVTKRTLKDKLKEFQKKYCFHIISAVVNTLFKIEKIFYNCKCINYPKEKCMFALWHAHQCGVFSCNMYRKTCIMVSNSQDGEIISRAANAVGVETVRGSQNRGGAKASFELIKRMNEEDINGALTIDGPRGPNRKVKKGIIDIAKMANVPIVPAVYWSPQKLFLQFKSWDKFRFPLVGTKLVMLFGDPIQIPENPTNEEIEKIRLKIENDLKSLYKDLKENYHTYLKQK